MFTEQKSCHCSSCCRIVHIAAGCLNSLRAVTVQCSGLWRMRGRRGLLLLWLLVVAAVPSSSVNGPRRLPDRRIANSVISKMEVAGRTEAAPNATRAVTLRCTADYRKVFIPYNRVVTFITPNFPEKYPPNTRCGWTFVTNARYVFDMFCGPVSLERYDFMDIWDLTSNTYRYLHAVSHVAFFLYFRGYEVSVGLESNRRKQASGFKCSIWPVTLNGSIGTKPFYDDESPGTTSTTTTDTTMADDTTTTTTMSTTASATSTSSCLCGKDLQASRIVGGKPAKEYEYPWMVSLGVGFDEQFCGGSLISDQWIVTAAHCISTSKLNVGLGYLALDDATPYTIVRKVLEIVVHPKYTKINEDNDIALLRISPVNWVSNRYIRPVCLPSGSLDYVGHIATVTGWGKLNNSGGFPKILQTVDVPVISKSECNESYGIITSGMICAGVPAGGIDSCQGDSGGPMTVLVNGTQELVGVVSWGIGCAQPGYPGVYARVTEYLAWIESITGTGGYCSRK